jgi:hypothetical protein
MKRIVVLVLCLLVLGTSAFAMDKAVGGGALFGYTFQGWTGSYAWDDGPVSLDIDFNRASFGAFAFFGLSQYVEFNLAFIHKSGDAEITESKYAAAKVDIDPTNALQIGVYGKYPFPVSDKVVVFPTGGLDIEFTLADEDKGWWHDFWIRAGVGLDYFFTDTVFLRSHAIYGVAIPFGSEVEPDVGHGFLFKVGVGYMF